MKMSNDPAQGRWVLVSNDARVESVVCKLCKNFNHEYAKFIV